MLSRSALRKVARIAGVTLEHPLGRGGQGVVWRVQRPATDGRPARTMALKVCVRRTRAQRQGFEHEAYVGAAVASEPGGRGVVGSKAVFRGAGWGALLQPWVDGISLAVLLGLWGSSGRVLGREPATVLLHDLAVALAPVHRLGASGWVHGDVTPHNVIVDRHGRVSVIDLGAAHPAGRPAARIVGHVGYMAPEQAAGDVLSPATDGYGVGRVVKDALGVEANEHSWTARQAEALLADDPQARPSLAAVCADLDARQLAAGRVALASAVRACIGKERASAQLRQRPVLRAAQRQAAARRRGSWVAHYRWLTTAACLGLVVGSWLRVAGGL